MSFDSSFSKDAISELVENTLAQAKKQGVDEAEISVNVESGFSVTARSGDVETLEHHQGRFFSVTVYNNKRCGSASTSDFSPAAITAALEKACSIAQYAGQDDYAGIADKALLARQYPDLQLYHPWGITPSQAIDMAVACEQLACEQDARIIHSEGVDIGTYNVFHCYANSNDFIGCYPKSYHSISCSLIAEEGGNKQRDSEYTVARRAAELEDTVLLAKHAAQKTVRRLGARRIPTQTCPVLFHAPVAKSLLAAFVSAISGGNLYRQSSFLLNHINKKVFPSHVHIHQEPHKIAAMGSAAFDGEGVQTCSRDYITEGVLTSYILGSYSARKLGMQSTGNAGGVYNLEISHSDKNLKALFAHMGSGLFVTELIGQGVNVLTGDYSRGAFGYWIENGEIQHAVEEVTIAGNLKDLFANLVMVGNDVDRRGRICSGSILLAEMSVAGH